MTDPVPFLRNSESALYLVAADEIEKLRAEVKLLRRQIGAERRDSFGRWWRINNDVRCELKERPIDPGAILDAINLHAPKESDDESRPD